MISNSLPLPNLQGSMLEKIWLEPEHYEQALCTSQTVINEQEKWHTYLNALAVFGFEYWFREITPALPLDINQSSLFDPPYASVIDAVPHLKVGEFQVCLVTIENVLNEMVSIPQIVIDIPKFGAHFYVLIEVQEELGCLILRGMLRRDKLDTYIASVNLKAQENWTYSLPLSLFDADPNHLLFNLRFLPPSAIPLAEPRQVSPLSALQAASLNQLLDVLKDPHRCLHHIMSWEQGANVLYSPKLMQFIYQWRQELTQTIPTRIQELFALCSQKAINTAAWLDGQLDDAAMKLGLFMPPVALDSGLRAPDKFKTAITTLRDSGMDIPPQVNFAYQDIDLDSISMRLCTVIWPVPPSNNCADTSGHSNPSQQWSLLLILGMQTDQTLPEGVHLRVGHRDAVLHDIEVEQGDPLVFARVEGNPHETYLASIVAPHNGVCILPPYTFAESHE